jgi:hypothetical protein
MAKRSRVGRSTPSRGMGCSLLQLGGDEVHTSIKFLFSLAPEKGERESEGEGPRQVALPLLGGMRSLARNRPLLAAALEIADRGLQPPNCFRSGLPLSSHLDRTRYEVKWDPETRFA